MYGGQSSMLDTSLGPSPTQFLGTGFLVELGVHFIEFDWLANLRELAVSILPVLELQMHAIAPGFLCCCLVIERRFSSFQGKHLVTFSLYSASSRFACFFCYCCLDLFPLFMDAHTHTTAHSAVIWLNYCHYFG